MKKIPKVSVSVPCYNHQKFIVQSIKSVLDQTFQDFEVIIADDCSSDSTFSLVQNLASKDERIRVFRNEKNMGPSLNVNNNIIKQARGEYIALFAADDLMHPERLEKQLKLLEANESCCAVFSLIDVVDGNGKQLKNQEVEKMLKQPMESRYQILRHFFYHLNFLAAPSVTLRKKDLLECNNYKNSSFQLQDFDLWVKLLVSKKDIMRIDEPLISYRISSQNLSTVGQNRRSAPLLSRSLNDLPQILKNYCNIDSIEEFEKIFPNSFYQKNLCKELIPFYIGIEAYEYFKKSGNVLYYSLAYDLISKTVDDDQLFSLCQKLHDYTIADFLELADSNPLAEMLIQSYPGKANGVIARWRRSIKKRLNKIF